MSCKISPKLDSQLQEANIGTFKDLLEEINKVTVTITESTETPDDVKAAAFQALAKCVECLQVNTYTLLLRNLLASCRIIYRRNTGKQLHNDKRRNFAVAVAVGVAARRQPIQKCSTTWERT